MFGPDMIFRLPALLIALTIHEYAHARVAVALGDPTPKFQGRLTLNPIAHLDPIGLIMLWLVQFGWAKPVEVNARNFKNWDKDMMMVALAGPGSNILMAFTAGIVYALVNKFGVNIYALNEVLTLTCIYNIYFAIFNLIPIPPLDGSKVLANYLPKKYAYEYNNFARYGTFVLIGLVYVGLIGVVITPISKVFLHMINIIINIIL